MVCIHENLKETYKFDDVTLYGCSNCKLLFTNRQNNFDYISLYKNYYVNEISSRFHFGVEYVIRMFRFFRAFKLFTIYPEAKTVLDVGSGRGFMLYYLKKYYGYKRTVGTQVSRNAVEFSREKLGLEIYNKDLLIIPFKNQHFDIITIWHVLEHVTEPEKYIQKMYKLLKKKGKLVIEVPNFNSWSRKMTGKYWLGLDLKYHITHFCPESLSFLLRKYRFKIIDIHTFSLEYSTFISTQSIISKITKSDQLFFRWLQSSYFSPKIIYHVFLFILLLPFCFLINVLFNLSKKGEVLLITAER